MAEQVKCWHYAMGSRQIGPLTWEELRHLAVTGGIVRQTLVWKTGMEHWVAAGRVLGLFEDVPVLVRPVAYAKPEEGDEKLCRRARQFAVTMFIALILGLVAMAELILETFGPAGMALRIPGPVLLVANIGVLTTIPMGLFAAVYLPYRWRVIRHLDKNHRLLALVGGTGLIVLLVGMTAGLLIFR